MTRYSPQHSQVKFRIYFTVKVIKVAAVKGKYKCLFCGIMMIEILFITNALLVQLTYFNIAVYFNIYIAY